MAFFHIVESQIDIEQYINNIDILHLIPISSGSFGLYSLCLTSSGFVISMARIVLLEAFRFTLSNILYDKKYFSLMQYVWLLIEI